VFETSTAKTSVAECSRTSERVERHSLLGAAAFVVDGELIRSLATFDRGDQRPDQAING
jgi:hypothetical protein